MHFALLLGFGADAICPYLAFETVRDLAEANLLEKPLKAEEAMDAYITAIKKGLLKTFSRMGISTLHSFFASQIFEAVGIGRNVIDRYFCGIPSRIEGLDLPEIARESLLRHRRGFPIQGKPLSLLEAGGNYHVRQGGEKHLLSSEAICKLQQAVWNDDYAAFKEYSSLIDGQSREKVTLRSLLEFVPGEPISLDAVYFPRCSGSRIGDRQALRLFRNVVRLNQPGGARNHRHSHEPPGRAQQFRRRWRGSATQQAYEKRR
jgi:glutamate synthase (NADPH) large chain